MLQFTENSKDRRKQPRCRQFFEVMQILLSKGSIYNLKHLINRIFMEFREHITEMQMDFAQSLMLMREYKEMKQRENAKRIKLCEASFYNARKCWLEEAHFSYGIENIFCQLISHSNNPRLLMLVNQHPEETNILIFL